MNSMVIFHGYVSVYQRVIQSGGLKNKKLKHMSSSVGMIKSPIYGNIKIMFQNHQPDWTNGDLANVNKCIIPNQPRFTYGGFLK